MAYHNESPSVRSTWDFEIKQPGTYEVKLSYKTSKKAKGEVPSPVFTVAGKQFKVDNLPLNPNEKKSQSKIVSLGTVELTASARETLTMTTDTEKLASAELSKNPRITSLEVLDVQQVEFIRVNQ